MKKLLLALALPVVLATQSHAITVTEGPADFAASYGLAFDIGPLQPGTHSVSGSLSLAASCPPVGRCVSAPGGDVGDAIGFSVSRGFRVTLAELVITGLTGQPTSFNIRLGSSTDLAGSVLANGAGPFDVLGTGPGNIVDPQTFRILASVIGNMAADGDTLGLNWTLNLEIAPIPLPAGALLLAGGLGALGLTRIRRRTA